MFPFTQDIQNITISTWNLYRKVLMRYFTFFSCQVSEIWCVFLAAHLNSDNEFSSEILDPYLGFIKLLCEEVDLYTQVITIILNGFPITELSSHF